MSPCLLDGDVCQKLTPAAAASTVEVCMIARASCNSAETTACLVHRCRPSRASVTGYDFITNADEQFLQDAAWIEADVDFGGGMTVPLPVAEW